MQLKRLAWLGLTVALGSGAIIAVWWRGRPAPSPEPTRKGGRFRIVQCPIHGIAYDTELETCPECTKTVTEPRGRG